MKICPCTVIIVTHNSQKFMQKNMECLEKQTLKPAKIVIVDSGSEDIAYLKPFEALSNVKIIWQKEDVGFCRGNNIAFNLFKEDEPYVLFLNPDAFLTETFLEDAYAFMERKEHAQVGVLSGVLLGYDIEKNQPTGKVDSSGIFQKSYGRWHDRHQGHVYNPKAYPKVEEVPAICGALMFCRTQAIKEALLRGEEVFNERFFMWKDDIELSLRLKKGGWKLVFDPSIIVYHCRGWQKDRRKMPRHMRLMAARNEVKMHWQFSQRHLPYSCLKYLVVALFNK